MAFDGSMPTYSSGQLVALADINRWVNNILFLYDYKGYISVPPHSGTNTTLANWETNATNNTGTTTDTHFMFSIPDDFSSLDSMEILIGAASSFTMEYDVATAYFNPDASEAYNNHTGTILNGTLALTANQPKLVSIASAVPNLAAGDFISVKIVNSAGANSGSWYPMECRTIYTKL